MKLNHIDLQVPDVQEAAAFFAHWFGFVPTSSRTSAAIAILRGDPDFTLVLQRARPGATYPDGFHIGFLVDDAETVVDFQRRARAGGLEVSDVERNGRGTMAYCYGPGRILVEVSCRRGAERAGSTG